MPAPPSRSCCCLIQAVSWLFRRTIGIGGPLGVGAAVHIFVGMVEAPLLVRPYLMTMSRGELFGSMSCDMAGIAGTVMVIYATIPGTPIPNALANILIASIISTPAALVVSALMVPFEPDPAAAGRLEIPDPPQNFMEAITRGTQDGIGILANILAMLIVLVALVSLVNLQSIPINCGRNILGPGDCTRPRVTGNETFQNIARVIRALKGPYPGLR